MTRVTRRTAILGAVGLGVAAATAAPFAAQASGVRIFDADAATPAPAMPGRSAWAPLVGTDVAVTGRDGIRTLRLAGVADLPATPAGDEDRFSLLFTTPVPVGGIVAFTGVAPAGAAVELFLSPVTQQQRTTAQAVVARI
jgi:hypothetical protein